MAKQLLKRIDSLEKKVLNLYHKLRLISEATSDTELTPDIYLDEEILTNKVWFGSPVYRKVIFLTGDDLVADPGTQIVPFGDYIENIGEVLNCNFKLISPNGLGENATTYPFSGFIPTQINLNFGFTLGVNGSYINFAEFFDATTELYVIVEYTKLQPEILQCLTEGTDDVCSSPTVYLDEPINLYIEEFGNWVPVTNSESLINTQGVVVATDTEGSLLNNSVPRIYLVLDANTGFEFVLSLDTNSATFIPNCY